MHVGNRGSFIVHVLYSKSKKWGEAWEQLSKRCIALLYSLVWQDLFGSHNFIFIYETFKIMLSIYIQISMSASVTMEVANTTVMTQMEITHAPAKMNISLIVMGIHAKVPTRCIFNTCATVAC